MSIARVERKRDVVKAQVWIDDEAVTATTTTAATGELSHGLPADKTLTICPRWTTTSS